MAREAGRTSARRVGRAGIELATLGLKVRAERLRPEAASLVWLQLWQVGAATSCS
jgi:hypothetical protein